MIVPPFLKTGDVIGVTAPSAGVSEFTDVVRFGNAASRLSQRGYGVRFTPDVYTDDEGRSAPAERRARELESLFLDDDVTLVSGAKGGDYLNEIFGYLDPDVLRDHPKWFQGYSDCTDICVMLTAQLGIMSVYGGHFGDYGMHPYHRSVTENLEILEGKRRTQTSYDMYEDGFTERLSGLEPTNGQLPVRWDSDGDVRMSGTLFGGCLDKFDMLLGTDRDCIADFAESQKDTLWYLETFESDRARLTESLRKMDEAGWFSSASGFVFGRPLFYEGFGRDYSETVRDALGHLGVPMVFDADVGHKAPRMTMVNGARADVTVEDGRAVLEYRF